MKSIQITVSHSPHTNSTSVSGAPGADGRKVSSGCQDSSNVHSNSTGKAHMLGAGRPAAGAAGTAAAAGAMASCSGSATGTGVASLVKKSLTCALLSAGIISLSGCQMPFAFEETPSAEIMAAREIQLDRAYGSLLESLSSVYALNSTAFAAVEDSSDDALTRVNWQCLRRALQHKGAMVCTDQSSCPAAAVPLHSFVSSTGSASGTLVELYNDDFSISALIGPSGELMGPAALRTSLPELYPGARAEATAAIAAADAAGHPSGSASGAAMSARASARQGLGAAAQGNAGAAQASGLPADSITGRMARLQGDFYNYLTALNQNLAQSNKGIVVLSDEDVSYWYDAQPDEPRIPLLSARNGSNRQSHARLAPAGRAALAKDQAAVKVSPESETLKVSATSSASSSASGTDEHALPANSQESTAEQKLRNFKFTAPLQSASTDSRLSDSLAFTRQALPQIGLATPLNTASWQPVSAHSAGSARSDQKPQALSLAAAAGGADLAAASPDSHAAAANAPDAHATAKAQAARAIGAPANEVRASAASVPAAVEVLSASASGSDSAHSAQSASASQTARSASSAALSGTAAAQSGDTAAARPGAAAAPGLAHIPEDLRAAWNMDSAGESDKAVCAQPETRTTASLSSSALLSGAALSHSVQSHKSSQLQGASLLMRRQDDSLNAAVNSQRAKADSSGRSAPVTLLQAAASL